VVFAQII
jgi:hypothetical protein